MKAKFICATALLAASQAVSAHTWNLSDHSVFAAGNDAVIELSGGSTSGCIPTNAAVEVEASAIKIDFAPVPQGILCFSAFRPWTYVVTVPALDNGDYDVTVLQDGTEIGAFSFEWGSKLTSTSPMEPFQPSKGMWWDSEQPGTGVAFNIDDQGRWFAAIYLYDEDGNPSFLTMQGEALEYDLTASPSAPYAIGTSPLILSQGGQCLKCPWTQATVSDTGDDAQLLFYTRTRAALTVGSWRLDLTLLPVSVSESQVPPLPEIDRHYALTLDGPIGRHVLVVKGVPGDPVFTGQTSAGLECVDCRSVDAEGQSSETLGEQLQDLVEQTIRFVCNPGPSCKVVLGGPAARTFIDEHGDLITALVPGEGNEEDTRIELRALPDGWHE